MCRSKAQGGQRCYSHAKAKFGRAVSAHIAARLAEREARDSGADFSAVHNLHQVTFQAELARDRATVELASTANGQTDLVAEQARLRDEWPAKWAQQAHARLGTQMRQGRQMQEANKNVLAASRVAPEQATEQERTAVETDARNEQARRDYELKATQDRAAAARVGHRVTVHSQRSPDRNSQPLHVAWCSHCKQLQQSVNERSAQMIANAHAGQYADAAANA